MSNPPIGILSMAYYLPPKKKAVRDVFRDEAIPTERLVTQIDFQADLGIESVHLGAEEAPSSIGLNAARQAVKNAAIDPAEIDLVLDFTSIPEDYVAPTWAAAGWVQKEIGAKRAWATAVNTGGCTSYHLALKTACALMQANERLNTALLFAGDKAPLLNHTYYPITVVCDGGSAVVLRKNHDRQVILAVEVATVGELHDVWYMEGLGNRKSGEKIGQDHLYMKSDMKRFNESVVTINLFMFRKVMKAAMKRVGLKSSDIQYYVYPTFSTWDQKSFCQGLSIPRERVYTEGLVRHGHMQENDMVMNYVDAVNEGKITSGDVVMVTTNGAGFAWGAAIIRN